MARKKKTKETSHIVEITDNIHIEGAGNLVEQPITETLEKNYMPYAMSVILSRALPEIDGFKPSHRKLLYTMYLDKLLDGKKAKSAKIVGDVMKLNPHGDQAIYETMVRMAKGNETLLNPYIDSKGNFGKAYSRDMAYAASRYTEAKLAPICAELFGDINKDTVDFVPNYDNTMTEPTLLPVTFPSVLANVTTGIAVGMASSICSFNLTELCETTIAVLRDKDHVISDTLMGPDFPGGGYFIYDREVLEKVYDTGKGSLKIRAKYEYDKKNNCIDITEIPPTTTIEVIIEKIIDLAKAGTVKEIADIRDETGMQGLRLTIDLKRGQDPDRLMAKLFKLTPLEDTFACNFNILVDGVPRVMGVREIIEEWAKFRIECVRRRTAFTRDKRAKQLHLLEGLQKILLDIDKAIKIIRETDEESDVVPNLMIGFGIDKIQAEYVAEIKLRHLNREFILKRTQDIEKIREEIAKLDAILESRSRIKTIIIKELKAVIDKYGAERRTKLLYADEIKDEEIVEEVPDYPVTAFFTKEGYFKKITPLSLRMASDHKLKEGDEIIASVETTNAKEVMFFTDKCQVYKARISDFADSKASVLGDYVPSALDMDADEKAVYMVVVEEYKGYMLFAFENGKIAKVDMSAYETKSNRKKLIKAYCAKFPLADMMYVKEDAQVVIISSSTRKLLIDTAIISPKTTKDTQGVAVMRQKKNQVVTGIRYYVEGEFAKPYRYKTKNLPAIGALPSEEDVGEQMSLI